MNPSEIIDCSLLVSMNGLPPAFNQRDLRERISVCSTDVLHQLPGRKPNTPSWFESYAGQPFDKQSKEVRYV